jgi:hypothetical protein
VQRDAFQSRASPLVSDLETLSARTVEPKEALFRGKRAAESFRPVREVGAALELRVPFPRVATDCLAGAAAGDSQSPTSRIDRALR